ncbi:hypothetical protein C2S51_037697 [Perilla frutescens var. frutescens]|nr:hypothetical protein C2S51_037697 [Perilla frutescens var. frutescens]
MNPEKSPRDHAAAQQGPAAGQAPRPREGALGGGTLRARTAPQARESPTPRGRAAFRRCARRSVSPDYPRLAPTLASPSLYCTKEHILHPSSLGMLEIRLLSTLI